MEATDHPGAMAAEVHIALGQEPQDLGVISRLDAAQVRGPKGRDGDREGVVGVVLVGAPGGEHPDARGQGGRHVEDLLAPGDELLGQQVAQPTGRLDGPGPLLEGLGPAHQLFHLAPGGPHLDARDLVFSLVDGHRCVRCLVGIDADHHLHDYLLGRDGTTEGTPACRLFVLDPLLSHSVGEAQTGRSSYESHPADAGGRHYESDPTRTSQRYGSTAASASSLKQALRGRV